MIKSDVYGRLSLMKSDEVVELFEIRSNFPLLI